MRAVLIGLFALAFAGCGDGNPHYASLVVAATVLRGGVPVKEATVSLQASPNDGASSTGKESATFVLGPAHSGIHTNDSGLAFLTLDAPETRKDYEFDELYPEREHHPGRYARSLTLSVDANGSTDTVFTFQKDDPRWRFVDNTGAGGPCLFDLSYDTCNVALTVNVP